MTIRKNILLIIFIHASFLLLGQSEQVYVGSNSVSGSAVAQFDANDRGILIPRLLEEERLSIYYGLQEGLLVFDLESDSYWYYDGGHWIEINQSLVHSIQDGDGDTKIWAEKTNNEDVLRFDVAGQEMVTVDNDIFKIEESVDLLMGNSLFGGGKKLFFDSSKSAFRMGEVDATQWDDFLIGDYSMAFGENTVASGDFSAAWGKGNLATGDYAVAFGSFTDATGEYAVATGEGSQATGDHSAAFGRNGEASGFRSTCFGTENTASGLGSTAFGFSTIASGEYATTFGTLTQANGENATAMGFSSIANGDNATAIGTGVVAESFAEAAFGRYNENNIPDSATDIDPDDRVFVIGNGTSNTNRKDAFRINKSGSVTSAGPIISFPRPGQDNSKVRFIDEDNVTEKGWELSQQFDFFTINRFDDLTEVVVMSWDSQGDVEIGNTFGNKKLNIGGGASKSTAGAWLANSDRRLKKEIETINESYALAQIIKMQGVQYEWKEELGMGERAEGKQYGFIAQDLKEIWPTKVEADAQGYLQTAYGDYDPMFVESFKAHQLIINGLEKEQSSLQTDLEKQEQVNFEIKEKLANLYEQADQLLQQWKAEQLSSDASTDTIHNDSKNRNE